MCAINEREVCLEDIMSNSSESESEDHLQSHKNEQSKQCKGLVNNLLNKNNADKCNKGY